MVVRGSACTGERRGNEAFFFKGEAFEKDVLRLSYFCKPFMSAKRVKELAELMTVTELIDFRGRLEKQAAENEEVYKAERESFITGDYKM